MATRRNLGGRYVEVRERNTSKGHRGTILKNWSSKRTYHKQENGIWGLIIILLIIFVLIWLIYVYFF